MTTPCSAPLIQPDSRGGEKVYLGKDSAVFIQESETWTFDEDSEGTVVINPLNRENATSREGPVTLTWSDLTEGEYYRGDCEESFKVLFLKDAPVDLKTNNCTIGSEPAVICSVEGARGNLDYELVLSSEKGGHNYLKTGQNAVTVLYGDLPEGTTDIKCRTRSVSWNGARYDVFNPKYIHDTLNTTYTCPTHSPITTTPPTTHPNTPNTGSAVVTVAAVSSILGLVIAVVVIALLVAMVIWIRRLHRRGGRVGQEETADVADNNSHDEQHHH
jgi:hypothetical protein